MKILHLSPHVGGGVGTVVTNYLRYCTDNSIDQHTLCCLDKLRDESKYFLDHLKLAYGENFSSNKSRLKDIIAQHDIVFLHWWNHPLTGQFLNEIEYYGEMRLVVWCHISGQYEPNVIPNQVIEISDKFIFTSPLSFSCKNLKILDPCHKDKLSWVWSTRGFELIPTKYNTCLDDRPSDMLYIGNLDYAKLSNKLFALAENICGDKSRLHIVGPSNARFLADLNRSPAKKFITYHGFISEDDKYKLLSLCKVFLYPLASTHYGTCDQTIQEAMLFGVVPVAFNNPMESYMIEDQITGCTSDSSDNLLEFARKILANSYEYHRFAKQCIEYARREYSLKKLSFDLSIVYNNSMLAGKRSRNSLLGETKNIGYELYKLTVPSISSLLDKYLAEIERKADGDASNLLSCYFLDARQESHGKSSLNQFCQYFPTDELLIRLRKAFYSGPGGNSE